MAVSTDTTRIVYVGNGSTVTPYAVTFRVQEVGQVRVSQRTNLEPDAPWTPITEGDYEVTLIPETGLAEVRTAAAFDDESDLLIYRVVDFTQEREYPVSGPFPAKSHEGAIDKLTMLAQQLRAGLQSSLQIRNGSDQSGDGLLPNVTEAGFIGFDDDLDISVFTAFQLWGLLNAAPSPGAVRVVSSASNPDTNDIPDGSAAVWRNTSQPIDQQVRLWANFGGTFFTVILYDSSP